MKVTINSDVKYGSVLTTENDVRAWKSDDVVSYTEFVYDEITSETGTITVYGLGDSETDWGSSSTPSANTYYLTDAAGNDTGYVVPDFDIRQDGYTVPVYKNGTFTLKKNYAYGNSLLIIGAENNIDIAVSDATASGTVKSSYNVSGGETTVNFEITPTLFVASSAGTSSDESKTDLTIVVTLPAELSVATNETAVSGTTSGGYDYDCSWEENSDGSWTITYTVYDVVADTSVGTLPLVAEIVIKEVDHAEELTVSAKVYSDIDQRECSTTNGNLATTSINIIKLSVLDVELSVNKTITELGEDIVYTITYTNTSATDAQDIEVIDILPYASGGVWASVFTGSYTLENITFDFSNAAETYAAVCESNGTDSIAVYYSSAEELAAADTLSVAGVYDVFYSGLEQYATEETAYTDINGYIWSALTATDISNNQATFEFEDADTSASAVWFVMDVLAAGDEISFSFTLCFKDENENLYEDQNGDAQQPGDYYANAVYQWQNGQAAAVVSNKVSTRVVSRGISGIVWEDTDYDGIREDGESMLSDITVQLLDSSGLQTTDVFGKTIANTTTNEDGEYSFENLPAGTYTVRFVFSDESWDNLNYDLTLINKGDDDAVDSDASAADTDYAAADITEIIMPTAETLESESSSYEYISKNNDAGVYSRTASLLVYKVASDDSALYISGAVYELYNSNDELIALFTTDDEGCSGLIEGLDVGNYYLVETQAPAGYLLNEEIYELTISKEQLGTTITYYVEDDVLVALPSTGGAGAGSLLLTSAMLILLIFVVANKKKQTE